MTKVPRTKVDEFKDALKAKKEAEVKVHEIKKEEMVKDSGEVEKLKKHIKELEEKTKECNDKMLRVAAEAENFKKRLTKEHTELAKYGHEKLVKELLPTLDDLDRVLEHCPHDAIPEVKAFVDGVELINKQYRSALAQFGLVEIVAAGQKFDPNIHEAVSHLPNADVPADNVMVVHRKGYMLNDRVLRPAMVSVSKGPEGA
jgi:molecular chaperone GrpE